MKCKRCGEEHDGSYGSGRFCSVKCARTRAHSKKVREKISSSVKKSLTKEVINNRINTQRNNGTLGWSKEAQRKGAISSANKKKELNEEYLRQGKYELLSNKFRRETLLKESNYSCEICNNDKWLGEKIWLEIHHKDSNKNNNKRENLIIVCPNCHSIIDNKYRFKNRKHNNNS